MLNVAIAPRPKVVAFVVALVIAVRVACECVENGHRKTKMDNENATQHLRPVWVPSTKETRFVTSLEQIKVHLDNIRGDDDSDYSNYTPDNTLDTMPDMDDEAYENNGDEGDEADEGDQDDQVEQAEQVDQAEQVGQAEPEPEPKPVKPVWNFTDEYVNFIDLTSLNPFIDPSDCQPDELIESEIREFFQSKTGWIISRVKSVDNGPCA